MLHLGMAPSKASELSRAHPIDHIERGIRYVRAAKNAKGPVGLFITMLTNGDFSKGPPPTPSPTIGARLVPPSRMRMWQLLEHRSIRIRARFREDAQRYLRAIDACWNDRLPNPEEISDELLRRAFEGDLDALREMADRASAVAAAA
jgi:hypothetical protein